MSELSAISRNDVAVRVSSALQRYVGPRKAHRYDDVADAIGVKTRTVQSWVLGEAGPPLDHWLKLVAILGPGFADDALAMAGVRCARVDDGDGADMSVLGRLTEAVNEFGKALANDGRIDHRERLDIAAALRQLMEVATPWLSKHDAQRQVVSISDRIKQAGFDAMGERERGNSP